MDISDDAMQALRDELLLNVPDMVEEASKRPTPTSVEQSAAPDGGDFAF